MNYEINKLIRDDFGRTRGILAINKPKGITSHDVVDSVRRDLKMRKVGHAGALDPFATGILIILVGKATKLSDDFLLAEKEYIADVLFGVQTDSADTEGKILDQQAPNSPTTSEIEDALAKFSPNYEQFVPVFSSVKVQGDKLRVLARSSDSFTTEMRGDKKVAVFKQGETVKEVELPKQTCYIPEIELLSTDQREIYEATYPVVQIRVACSKGTYVRALAEDIGAALQSPQPAMLVELKRTRVADITIGEAIELDQVANL